MFSILIVDNPGAREVLAEELAFKGYTVMITGDGETAREAFGTCRPDLVILDPFLRGRSRWDLLAAMKEESPSLPVLIVTDYATYRQDPHLALADGYLNKDSCAQDLYIEELKEKVTKILNDRYFPPGTTPGGYGPPFGSSFESDRKPNPSSTCPFH